MAPFPKNIFDIREPFPGNIKVTPIPDEPPIHGRPVLQSHESTYTSPFGFTVVNNATTFPFHVSSGGSQSSSVNWPTCILVILLAVLLGAILSKWGWSKITGRIWKWSNKWEGPLEMEDEEELLPERGEQGEVAKEMEVRVNVEEIYGAQHELDAGEYSLEDWINKRPREMCNISK